MAKFTAFFIIVALLLFSTLTYASARPISTSVYPEEISIEVSQQYPHCSYCIQIIYVVHLLIIMVEIQYTHVRIYFCYAQKLEQGEENCEGVGEEECVLIRRTLVAHTDYIYTQNHNHP